MCLRRLVSQELATFWTGHSARHSLPSWSAAIGVAKEQRDYVGRWSSVRLGGGSNDYTLTSRQIVHDIQTRICRAILEGDPAPGVVEEELMADLANHPGAEEGLLAARRVLKWDSAKGAWCLGGKFPLIGMKPEVLQNAKGEPLAAGLEATEEDEPDAPYFVSITRGSGFRRLHLAHACAVRQSRCLETMAVYELREGIADAVCKLCRPKISELASSSDSASDEGLEEASVSA